MHDLPELLLIDEVAVELAVSSTTVYRMLRDGRLGGIRVGKGWRISRQHLNDYLRGHEPEQRSTRAV